MDCAGSRCRGCCVREIPLTDCGEDGLHREGRGINSEYRGRAATNV